VTIAIPYDADGDRSILMRNVLILAAILTTAWKYLATAEETTTETTNTVPQRSAAERLEATVTPAKPYLLPDILIDNPGREYFGLR